MLTSLHKFKDSSSAFLMVCCVFFFYSFAAFLVFFFAFALSRRTLCYMMTDTDDKTMAATPIIDKLNGNICVAAATLFFFYYNSFLFCARFYSTLNPIWLNVHRNSICKLNDTVTHTHFCTNSWRTFACWLVFYVFQKGTHFKFWVQPKWKKKITNTKFFSTYRTQFNSFRSSLIFFSLLCVNSGLFSF